MPIPEELIPADAHVEIDAKVALGYHGGAVFAIPTAAELATAKGRHYGEQGDPLSSDFKGTV